MQRPMELLVPIGRVTTMRARVPDVVATVGDDLGLWQVCGCGDPGAWVGAVLTWTEHHVALLAQRFGPELYDKRLLGATRCSRYSLQKQHVVLSVSSHVAMRLSPWIVQSQALSQSLSRCNHLRQSQLELTIKLTPYG